MSSLGILSLSLMCLLFMMASGGAHEGLGDSNSQATKMVAAAAAEATTEMAVTLDFTVSPEEAKMCRKFMMIMGKRFMKVFNGCFQAIKQAYPEKEEFDKRFQCVVKCSIQKVNMLDENFRLSNATYVNFVNEHVPTEYHNLVYRMAGSCVTKYSTIITGKDDPYCLTYGDSMKCVQTTMARVCKAQE